MSIFNNSCKPLTTIERLQRLNEIGIALSVEEDIDQLMQKILFTAMEITNADGGTLYNCADDALHFNILLNESLDLHHGGSGCQPCELPPVKLRKDDGSDNLHNVAAYAAITKQTVNIADSCNSSRFDFSGIRAFDEAMQYSSRSFLTIPMINHENRVINVLQLINARTTNTQNIIAFPQDFQDLVESLASQAAVAISNRKLIQDQKNLFEAFIELIAGAIDDKSPYTGGHCRRVPELTLMLANATITTQQGPLTEFNMEEDDFYALKIAGWLHDCGKIVTPEHIVDKATKLQTIHDRIHEIDTRFEILKRDAEISYLKALANNRDDDIARQQLDTEYQSQIEQINADRNFIRNANIGREFISAEDKQRICRIGAIEWTGPDNQLQPLLSEEESYNLQIARGTLTEEERKIINGHMDTTIKMLEQLPYPDYLANVPEYAGGHHEKMDGTGYPRGLTREQLSIPARIMAVADIFEAITAPDRPYRDPLKLSEALDLMGKFKNSNHIDPDIFDIFIREQVYMKYALEFMLPTQIDSVDENNITGYTP